MSTNKLLIFVLVFVWISVISFRNANSAEPTNTIDFSGIYNESYNITGKLAEELKVIKEGNSDIAPFFETNITSKTSFLSKITGVMGTQICNIEKLQKIIDTIYKTPNMMTSSNVIGFFQIYESVKEANALVKTQISQMQEIFAELSGKIPPKIKGDFTKARRDFEGRVKSFENLSETLDKNSNKLAKDFLLGISEIFASAN